METPEQLFEQARQELARPNPNLLSISGRVMHALAIEDGVDLGDLGAVIAHNADPEVQARVMAKLHEFGVNADTVYPFTPEGEARAVEDARATLSERLGREPTQDEIAHELMRRRGFLHGADDEIGA